MMLRVNIIFLTLMVTVFANAQQLLLHPVPNELRYSRSNHDFTAQVRIPGQEWQDLFEYTVMVDADKPQAASMVQFDFSGKVEMRVMVNNASIYNVKIRPASVNIGHTVKGNVIYFSLEKPAKLSLEINGDKLHNLHIFANEPEKQVPDKNDPNVIYFGPGVHNPKDLPGNVIRIPSGKTVYLASGAVVQAKFVCNRVSDVKFLGSGIIDNPERGFELTHSKNISIDGIMVINPAHYTVYGGEVDGLQINNLKSFSARGWSDGIDLMSCSNVTINDVFLRTSDDCIAIYGHRWDYYGDAKNYKITNAVLWADVAHPINIGLHGDAESENGNVIEDLSFANIDILVDDEDDRNYQGCIAFSVSDKNLVQNVTFENIRIDDFEEGQLFNIRVLFNQKYSNAAGRGVRNVLFKNITYNGDAANPSIIEGFSEKQNVQGIKFENIFINGKKANSLEAAGIKVGKFTKGISLK